MRLRGKSRHLHHHDGCDGGHEAHGALVARLRGERVAASHLERRHAIVAKPYGLGVVRALQELRQGCHGLVRATRLLQAAHQLQVRVLVQRRHLAQPARVGKRRVRLP